MAIAVADGFQYLGAKPLDSRIKYDTLAAMKSVPDANLYDGCMAYCVATDKYYKWLSSNTVDTDLGKWREYESGSSYTAGDGIVIDNDEISTDNLQSGDIADCLYPLPTPTPDVISLGGLTDVALTDPTNGQVLKYNSTTQAWENGEGGGGGTTYTAGDGINIDANNEISTDNLQSGDMDDVLATLPGLTSKYNVYSTTEQVVGEWIGGQKLYQITAVINNPVESARNQIGVNIANLKSIEGYVVFSNNAIWPNGYYDGTHRVCMASGSDNTSIVVKYEIPSGVTISKAICTIRYTKS